MKESNKEIYHPERLCRLYEYEDIKAIQYLKPFCQDDERLKDLQETVELLYFIIFEKKYYHLKTIITDSNSISLIEEYIKLKWKLFSYFGVINQNGEMIKTVSYSTDSDRVPSSEV